MNYHSLKETESGKLVRAGWRGEPTRAERGSGPGRQEKQQLIRSGADHLQHGLLSSNQSSKAGSGRGPELLMQHGRGEVRVYQENRLLAHGCQPTGHLEG